MSLRPPRGSSPRHYLPSRPGERRLKPDMPDFVASIPLVRQSVAAILRVRRLPQAALPDGRSGPPQFQATLGGSAFCIAANRLLLTAFHILNGGKPRDTNDKFFAFVVPGNGDHAYHFPVTGFPVERPDVDMAVLEIGPCATAGVGIPSIGVSCGPHPDGSEVITMGYPSPEISGLNLDPEGNFRGGNFFLKSHANTGIVSAQYGNGGKQMYELNVGWHNGESGGPITTLTNPPLVFALMQHYRNVQSPHGIQAGPHRGFALSAIAEELAALGVTPR